MNFKKIQAQRDVHFAELETTRQHDALLAAIAFKKSFIENCASKLVSLSFNMQANVWKVGCYSWHCTTTVVCNSMQPQNTVATKKFLAS